MGSSGSTTDNGSIMNESEDNEDRSSVNNGTTNGAEGDLQKILSLPGVEKVMQYQYPNTVGSGSSPPTSMDSKMTGTNNQQQQQQQQPVNHCFQVQCLGLLDVIRTCDALAS